MRETMPRARSVLLVALCWGLLAGSARADLIPTSRPGRGSPAEPPRAVAERLDALGVGHEEAASRLARLSAADLDYFGARAERVQLVGEVPVHNFWYENMFGYAFLGATVFGISWLIVKNRDS